MKVYTFLTLLIFLALLAKTDSYMDPLEEGEDENDDGELSEEELGKVLDSLTFVTNKRCGN